MKNRSNNHYAPNFLDRWHLGFLNLVVYALLPHSKAERDELVLSRPLTAGELNGLWPRPWLYMRTLLLFVVALLVLFFCWRQEGREEASYLFPGLVVVGALAVPVTLLIFFWEINKWRTLTLLDVLRYFLIGSCLAITITFAVQYVLDLVSEERIVYDEQGHSFTLRMMMDYGLMPLAITACVEEFAKAFTIVVILLRWRGSLHILHGILVGAAVGAGFAVFESAGYIATDIDNLLYGILIRSLTAPACHVAWGALMGGALALSQVTGHRSQVTSKLRLPRLFVFAAVAYMLVCAMHVAWNYLLDASPTINRSIELAVLTWFLLLLLIWRGVREIGNFK